MRRARAASAHPEIREVRGAASIARVIPLAPDRPAKSLARYSVITVQAIRRGSWDSVRNLERGINKFVAAWTENARPFRWVKTAREIRRKIRRASKTLDVRH